MPEKTTETAAAEVNQEVTETTPETEPTEVAEGTETKVEGNEGETSEEGAPETETDADGNPIENKNDAKSNEPEIELEINGTKQKFKQSEVYSMAQKVKAADERFMEASQARDQVVNFIREAKSDPQKLLKELGYDPRKFAEDYLSEIYADEALPESERKIKNLEKENAEYKARMDAEKKAQEDAQVNYYVEAFTKEISSALQTAKLPVSQNAIQRVAGYIQLAKQKNVSATIEEIIGLVKEDYANELKAIPKEELSQMIGVQLPSQIDENGMPANKANPSAAPKTHKTKKITWNDFRKELDGRFGV